MYIKSLINIYALLILHFLAFQTDLDHWNSNSNPNRKAFVIVLKIQTNPEPNQAKGTVSFYW